MAAVKLEDLSIAFDFVNSGAPMENEAYVSLDTGKIYWISDFNDGSEEEIPEDLETSDRYLVIPHKNELGLGKRLVLQFVAQELPESYDEVDGFFRRKGAYARFKDLLEHKGILQRWFAFEAESVEIALKQWCADNGLEILLS
ncbi:UPF0158 family protein [Cupriavidus oxalaticus]|jgi:hypothetical protein|uniref:Uncharacterized protein n=1 Tax=Cupriavidus oxalaticus TaxID=96344 RepID=A0A5P3VFZ7_9BURK|nr:UPF0158 family protein [Cupriavidus oxalaticus]QEZ44818.1 hypothetical protein D2917_11670 [Cupriavidus oxalaticus]QRQ83805.1 hypothetical protein JTE91_08250 [Cupriavidus oxalaticus]QRQ92106.1 hypothetical protein JTE92_04095 [Cupriavidus oxalaticus]WQD86705.1 UPF0158 family protein [Cupriavidus oxalaticus]